MRTLLIVTFIVFQGAFAVAAETAGACAGFTEADALMWQNRKPGHPGTLRLARAWLTYRNEGANLARIKYDKWAHCYGGCRIAQDVDAATVLYVAWLKEDRDLRDCNARTHFDPLDEDATNLGAQLAPQAADAAACLSLCKQALPR